VRSAHMALEQGRIYAGQEGRGFIVDLDLGFRNFPGLKSINRA